MKKIALICILFLSALSLYAISDDYITGYQAGYSDATNSKANKFPVGKKLGETSTGIWRINYFIDEFGDYTEDGYITTDTQYGTFSNSATRNDELAWIPIISGSEISFVLYEYERYQVTGHSYSPDKYKISIKKEDGSVITCRGENSDDRIYITENAKAFIDLLFAETKIKIIIQKDNQYSTNTSYNLGTIDCSGFSNICKELFGE